jgi:hypothetical protein
MKQYKDKIMRPEEFQRMKNNQRINHGKKRKNKNEK